MLAHHGGVNRVRAMPQQPHVAATWGETGHVQVTLTPPPCAPLAPVSPRSYSLPPASAAAAPPLLLCAAERGCVRVCAWQVWDVAPQLRELAALPGNAATGAAPLARQAPLHVFSGHPTEGFALDWSPTTTARLATGEPQHGSVEERRPHWATCAAPSVALQCPLRE